MIARAQKPLWIYDGMAPQVTIDNKTYNIGQYKWPEDRENECNTLGAILRAGESGEGNNAFKRLSFMRWDDYYWKTHAIIFKAMENISLRGDAIDLQSVKSELMAGNRLESVGGELYLAQLANRNAPNLETYAKAVVRASLGRAIIVAGDILKDLGTNALASNLEQMTNALPRAIRDIQVRLQALDERNTTSLGDALDAYMPRLEAELADKNFEPGISSGITSVDKILLGFRKDKLYIFAGPPGWGKTALTLCFALNAYLAGKRVLFISLEMGVEEIIERLISNRARVNSLDIQKRKLTKSEIERVHKAVVELKSAVDSRAFQIVHLNQPTMQTIETKLIELQFNPGYDLVFIDYIAATTISGTDANIVDDENRLTSYAYKELKRWKTDYDIPLVVTTQMNSKWDSHKGKRPGETDLYYGTAGRQAADVIAFVYHEWKVNEDADPNQSELIFKKNRSGPVGDDYTAYLRWEPEYVSFTGVDENPHGHAREPGESYHDRY